MRRVLAVVAVIGCAMGSAVAQDTASYRTTFEATLADIEASCTQRIDGLAASYLRSLEALYEQCRASGDLAGSLASKTEQDRFKPEKSAPPSLSDHPGTAALQTKYRQTVHQYQVDRARQTVSLADQYDHALDRLQRGYVVAEELEQAQVAQRERDRAKALPAVAAARKLVVEADAAKPASPAVASVPAKPSPATSPLPYQFGMKDAKELIAKLDKLSEQEWRKLPGTVVTVDADAGKVCDSGIELAAGDAVLLVPHPRDEWTPWDGRIQKCDYRGLRGGPVFTRGPGERGPGPRLRMGDLSPMALCATVGRGFPFAVEGNYLVTGQGKLDLAPGLRAIRLENADPSGSIRVKLIRVQE